MDTLRVHRQYMKHRLQQSGREGEQEEEDGGVKSEASVGTECRTKLLWCTRTKPEGAS